MYTKFCFMTASLLCPSQVPRCVYHLWTSPLRKPWLCGDNRGARRLASELPPCQVPGDEWSELQTQLHHVLSRHALALQQQPGAAAGQLFGFIVSFHCCFTSTETIRLIRDGEARTATSTSTQLLSSEHRLASCRAILYQQTLNPVGEPRLQCRHWPVWIYLLPDWFHLETQVKAVCGKSQ